MRRLMRRSTRQYIIVAIICILVIGGAAAATTFLSVNMFRLKYDTQLSAAMKELDMNKRVVYTAAADMKAGDTISSDKVRLEAVYSSQQAESFMEASEIGKTAVIDIPAGTLVVKAMLTDKDILSEFRELEYNVINISSNIDNNDAVDVRILYPNGESFIILAKKTIMKLIADTATCCFWLDEEELLRMSAAIVDAGLYAGSSLMVTRYIEPSIQEASVITYTPSLPILSLIEEDPNIVNRCSQELSRRVRKALENRLAKSMELNVSEICWEEDPDSDGATSATAAVSSEPGDVNREKADAPVNPTPAPGYDYKGELGSVDDGFMFYTDEVNTGEGDIEFGE